ncbi:carbon storage regulator [Pseudomonas sp. NPDC087346]|uniref:carbon storage regulator n=1 Tax=Pseudomonas sp. NPDC087346 TaxID=3364438 RepID=UPI003808D057
MLVLSRCIGECLMIGEDIQLDVVNIENDIVTLNIATPPQIQVSNVPRPRRSQYKTSVKIKKRRSILLPGTGQG